MRRREFIAGLGSAAVLPVVARAQQQPMPTHRLAALRADSTRRETLCPRFTKVWRQTGYIEGRNVTIEYRWAEGNNDRLPVLAADLFRRSAAVIVAPANSAAALAAKAATQTIPVLFMVGSDPVERGLVTSFSHPGGNVTGNRGAEQRGCGQAPCPTARDGAGGGIDCDVRQSGQRLLRGDRHARGARHGARARRARVDRQHRDRRRPCDGVCESCKAARWRAFDWLRRSFLGRAGSSHIARRPLCDSNLYLESKAVTSGGLSSYGPDLEDEYRQLGVYTGLVLRGEKPADLPMIQPAKFELTVNMRTAKTLGLEIPPAVLAIADDVIE
jgi:putative tryptophan/tyrosine transport system substrate-binding protein